MTEIEKEETKNTFEIANIIKQSNISLEDTPVYAIADLLSNAGYRKQEDTVKKFIEKVKAKLQKHRETLIYPETEEDEASDWGCNYGLDLAIEDMQNIAKLFYNDGTCGDCNACEMQAKNKEDDQ